jgi:hypothetical protein
MLLEGSPKDCLIDTGNHENIYLQKTAFKSTQNSPTISSIDLRRHLLPPVLPRAAIGADPVPADEPDEPDEPYHFFLPPLLSRLSLLSLLLIVDPASARR